jgi:hypothetical protein
LDYSLFIRGGMRLKETTHGDRSEFGVALLSVKFLAPNHVGKRGLESPHEHLREQHAGHRGRQVMELFRKVAHERGAAVLVVTNDQRSLDVFDRTFQMEDGCLKP